MRALDPQCISSNCPFASSATNLTVSVSPQPAACESLDAQSVSELLLTMTINIYPTHYSHVLNVIAHLRGVKSAPHGLCIVTCGRAKHSTVPYLHAKCQVGIAVQTSDY